DALQAPARQTLPPDGFQVIIVDHDSTDDRARVTAQHPGVALLKENNIACRVGDEPRRGLLYARLRGVLEARAEAVCFLDDDTEPEATYVAEGIAAFDQPEVGVVVSRVFPRYEQEPPYSIARREHLLAVNQMLGDEPID